MKLASHEPLGWVNACLERVYAISEPPTSENVLKRHHHSWVQTLSRNSPLSESQILARLFSFLNPNNTDHTGDVVDTAELDDVVEDETSLIKSSSNKLFRKHAIPKVPHLTKPKMVTPKPDIIYGFSPDTFTTYIDNDTAFDNANTYWVNSDCLFFHYFVVEAKSYGGNIFYAETQCLGT
ncbi:hypothetical protein F4804DRAFT_325733 [Jackrogersella minutella]|nr:hypothetical protein F4804DRAFT_325733 [Jackrogersella minutella]